MPADSSPQAIFERYLAGELSLSEAADAVTACLERANVAGRGTSDLQIKEPAGMQRTPSLISRSEAFFEEMDRRARA